MDEIVLLVRLLKTLPQCIEILPGDGFDWIDISSSIYPYLLQEGHLGIPKKPLYKAYMTATCIYQQTKQSPEQSPEILADSTSVILLANPAHQTALNTRKRMVMNGVLDPTSELKFTSSLLSCQECAKESILWHHRRWLLHRTHGNIETEHKPGVSSGSFPWPLPSEIVCEEFTVVSRACELYPRNYHAWAHRYFCMKSLFLSANSESTPAASYACKSALIDEYRFMLHWIDRHISDYSAMQYMCSLEQTISSLIPDTITSKAPSPDTIPSVRLHALSLLRSYSDHESLWMYLRSCSVQATVADSSSPADCLALTNGKSHPPSYLLRHIAWTAHQDNSLKLSGQLAREVVSGTCPGVLHEKFALYVGTNGNRSG